MAHEGRIASGTCAMSARAVRMSLRLQVAADEPAGARARVHATPTDATANASDDATTRPITRLRARIPPSQTVLPDASYGTASLSTMRSDPV